MPSLEKSFGFGTWDSMGPLSNGIFFHPTLKYPAAPKIPSSVDTTKYPVWSLFVDIPWLLGHRTAWDHYKMENHPKKYPAAPKIPSSVDTTKYPAWSLLSTGLGFWTWDRYKIENFLHPTKNQAAPKYPALSTPQNTQLGVFKFDIPDNMGPL